MSNFEPSWRREMRRDILSCLLYGHILISKSRYCLFEFSSLSLGFDV